MKRQNKILSVLLFILVYCFGVGFSCQKSNDTYKLIEEGSKHETQFSSRSKVFYFHTPTSETSTSEISEYISLNYHQNFDAFWAILLLSVWCFNALFKQYNAYLNTVWIRYRKSDIIFPFHCFW